MKASVRIMRSYDYCHFEVQLGCDDVQTIEAVDELRKEAQRLADKAVAQYQTAKEKLRDRLNLDWEREQIERELQQYAMIPENEWPPEIKAKKKKLEDHSYWSQHDYDYENED